ncbi:MAG: L,D-transpeptidase family protein [Bacteroidota bacterium]
MRIKITTPVIQNCSQITSAVRLLGAFTVFGLFVFSCSPKTPESEQVEVIKVDSTAIKAAIQRSADSNLIAFFLHENISSILIEEEFTILEEPIFSKTMLPQLYDSIAYRLIWNSDTLRREMLNVLLDAKEEGLEPSNYHVQKLLELEINPSYEFKELVERDILLTDGLILYSYHLLNGMTDANSFEPTLTREEREVSPVLFNELTTYLFHGEIKKIVSDLRPSTVYYSGMVEGLKKYSALRDSGGWAPLQTAIKKIEPHDEYRKFIPKLRKRLLIEGDLELLMDSLQKDSLMNNPVYDSLLVDAVKKFQIRHGLNDDGIIGKGTLDMLNISAEEKVELLKINLERARWVYHDLPPSYVFVNIPGYELRLIRDSALVWSTRVVAGKITSATPIFKDEMQYVVFNPTWTVPSSISNNEFLPKAQKDSTFFQRNNMELITGSGKKVNPADVDFSQIKVGNFPYVVKQGAGGSNSLGRVKFIFPNPHYIYLHDTPSRRHFARERRAFSHGCIRVEDPIRLSELILEDQEVSPDSIQSILETREPTRLNLEEILPVYLTYSTAFADENNIYFFEDVYERDPPLLEALGLD